MQIWNFDPTQENMLVHGGAAVADPDPLTPGQWLIPANATPVPAPADKPGQTRHFDAVSSVWYFKPIPPEPPAPPQPTAQELRRAEILGRLSAIDAASVRPAREVTSAMAAGQPAPAFAASKLAALETEAGALRLELAAL